MSAPVILGIDPQTPGIGVGIVCARTGTPLHAGWVPISREGWYEHCSWLAFERANVDGREWKVVAVVVERVGGGRGVQSMLTVADCAGICAAHAVHRWPEATLNRPTPGEWKRAAGIKGNANKDMVRAHAWEIATEELRWEWGGPDQMRQDALDALIMAYGEWRTFDKAARAEQTAIDLEEIRLRGPDEENANAIVCGI